MGKTKSKIKFTPSEQDRCLNTLDMQPILKHRVRRVKWLYNNNNKMTFVYDEKLVRLMVFKLEQEILMLRNKLTQK